MRSLTGISPIYGLKIDSDVLIGERCRIESYTSADLEGFASANLSVKNFIAAFPPDSILRIEHRVSLDRVLNAPLGIHIEGSEVMQAFHFFKQCRFTVPITWIFEKEASSYKLAFKTVAETSRLSWLDEECRPSGGGTRLPPAEIPGLARFANAFQAARLDAQGDVALDLALTLYVQSSEYDSEEAVVSLWVCLEALLMIRRSEKIGERVRHRAAVLTGENREDERAIDELLRRMYACRSAIVHGDPWRDAFEIVADVEAMRQLARRCIMAVLSVQAEFGGRRELLKALDTIDQNAEHRRILKEQRSFLSGFEDTSSAHA